MHREVGNSIGTSIPRRSAAVGYVLGVRVRVIGMHRE
jgi:hypothetical protein